MRVKNKTIIVTGAGSGMGAAIAVRLASEGANVIVNDIIESRCKAVTSEILDARNSATYFIANMTKSCEVKELMEYAIARYGNLDVVINNAGWTHYKQSALSVTEDEFDKVYDTNVKSIYLSSIHAIPIFRLQGGGSFINIGSTAGIRSSLGLSWYNGTKAAVIITSRSLAVEFGPENIRTNVINPGFNPTTRLSEAFAGGPLTEETLQPRLAAVPLGRFTSSTDVANAALYLASDEAAFINGTCIEVDGGRSV